MFGRKPKTESSAPRADEEREPATTVQEREPATTAQEREPATTAQEREPATTAQEREPATTVQEREPATMVQERDPAPGTDRRFEREPAPDVAERDWEPTRERRMLAPVVDEDTVVAMRARQRSRFGGIRWGSAFFGLLSAIGLASILLGIVAAAGVALNVSQINDVTKGNADTIGLGGAILLLVALAVAWYCGGYVAARMARFDGARQGVGVWGWTVVIGAALAIAALIGGSEYDVFQQLNLPNVAVGDASLTTGGILTLAAALVVTLACAIVGGIAGNRYHRRVDRFAAREHYELR
jgi:hypothetical protein